MIETDPLGAMMQRSQAIATAIERAVVAAGPAVAVSPLGIGLDLLAQGIARDPGFLDGIRPFLALGVDALAYIDTGAMTPALSRLFAGDLGLAG